MTNNHRRIIRYLELKGKLAGPLFLDPADITAIKSWPDDIVRYVWRRLTDHITILNKDEITAWTCPFCIRHWVSEGCTGCEWGENHGKCSHPDSDVRRLNNYDKFTNKFYRRIIQQAGGGL